MAGLTPSSPTPQSITVHGQSRQLELVFSDGAAFRLPFELLRVYSPSAEVMGHAPGQEVLQTGKRNVDITGIEPVGNYAVKLQFSDGHDSGIFSWNYLYALGAHQEARWADYLRRLEAAGADRDTPMPGRKAAHSHGSGCGSGGGCG